MPTSSSGKRPSDKAPSVDEAAAGEAAAEPGFDVVLDRLRLVVQRLEQGNLPLEQALQAFEEGVKLSRRGSAILDAAEQRVELLTRDESGSERRQPLPPSGSSGSAEPRSSL
jgi:exodeoxyribonuclease VII small subunit